MVSWISDYIRVNIRKEWQLPYTCWLQCPLVPGQALPHTLEKPLHSWTRFQILGYSLPDSLLRGKITKPCIFQTSSQQHGLHDANGKFRKKNSKWSSSNNSWQLSREHGEQQQSSDDRPESGALHYQKHLNHWPCCPCAFCTLRILQKPTVSPAPLKPFKHLPWPLGSCPKTFSLQYALSWMLKFLIEQAECH